MKLEIFLEFSIYPTREKWWIQKDDKYLKIQNDWIRQEDFDDDANRKFLEQVYQLIKVN